MINTNTHKLPYGTILSVAKIHRNRKGYMATQAEVEKIVPVYVAFGKCEEIK